MCEVVKTILHAKSGNSHKWSMAAECSKNCRFLIPNFPSNYLIFEMLLLLLEGRRLRLQLLPFVAICHWGFGDMIVGGGGGGGAILENTIRTHEEKRKRKTVEIWGKRGWSTFSWGVWEGFRGLIKSFLFLPSHREREWDEIKIAFKRCTIFNYGVGGITIKSLPTNELRG